MEKLDIYRQTIGSQAIALVDLNAELAARAARIGELEQSVEQVAAERDAAVAEMTAKKPEKEGKG